MEVMLLVLMKGLLLNLFVLSIGYFILLLFCLSAVLLEYEWTIFNEVFGDYNV